MRPDPSSRLANERNHPRFNIRSQSGKHKKRWEFPEKTKYAGLINRNPLMKQRSSDKRSLPGSILASLSSVSEKLTSLAGALVPILILATSEKPQTTTTLPLPSHGSYLLLLSHSMKYSALALNPDWAWDSTVVLSAVDPKTVLLPDSLLLLHPAHPKSPSIPSQYHHHHRHQSRVWSVLDHLELSCYVDPATFDCVSLCHRPLVAIDLHGSCVTFVARHSCHYLVEPGRLRFRLQSPFLLLSRWDVMMPSSKMALLYLLAQPGRKPERRWQRQVRVRQSPLQIAVGPS